MSPALLPLALSLVAMVLYHLTQKLIAPDVPAFASMTLTYVVALVASIVVLILDGQWSAAWGSLGRMNWATYALGIVIVALEVGALLAYRRGWNITTFGLVFNALAALVLLPIGLVWFREKLSATNWLGAALCLAGLFLLARK
jgi:drug/metabolite transporter (DMT)-like permease